jgi:hypothetical protein
MDDHGHGSQLVKLLTGNDVGSTGSHQAGVHVPKPLVSYFPPLAEGEFNPDTWLEVSDGERSWRWRYIHYNNEVHGIGTRVADQRNLPRADHRISPGLSTPIGPL